MELYIKVDNGIITDAKFKTFGCGAAIATSSMVTELVEPVYVGTALTLQTAVGFLLTILSIRILPIFVRVVGWSYGFTILALGPIIGIISLVRLRKLPDSEKIAMGKR